MPKYRFIFGKFEAVDGGTCPFQIQRKDWLFWKPTGKLARTFEEAKELVDKLNGQEDG